MNSTITLQTFESGIVQQITVATVSQTGERGPQGERGIGIPEGGSQYQLIEKGAGQTTNWTSQPTLNGVNFDTQSGLEAESEGELIWDTDNGTIDLGMNYGAVQRVGLDTLYRVQADESISKGDLCIAVGTIGNSAVILTAKARPEYNAQPVTSQQIMGLATVDIPQGERGYVTAFGRVRKIDTSAFEEGDILWADPEVAGGLTSTRPTAPNWKTIVALVITKSATVGSLQVRPTFGSSLANDELVNLNGLADNYVLRYKQSLERFEAEALGTAADSDATDFATAAQGQLADTAIQPNDNISTLTNDANYIDSAGAPVQSVDGFTGTVDLSGEYDALGSASAVQSNLNDHENATTNVHGIADTSQLIVDGDSRLTDTRTPTDGSVSDAKITSGGLSPASIAGTAVIDSDSRLSDERTPEDNSITNAKVATNANIDQSKIDGLESALDGKANLVGGKVPQDELPALALTEVFSVADIAARDALTVQEGDVAIVQDAGAGESASFIYDGTEWKELLTPTDGVTSVSGTAPISSTGGNNPTITLDDLGVDTSKIANGAVTDEKIDSGGLSPAKITGTAVIDSDARLSEGIASAETVRSLGTGPTQALAGDTDIAGAAPVQSVNTKTGDVVLDSTDVGALPSTAELNSLANVNITNPQAGDVLQFDGTNWVNVQLTDTNQDLYTVTTS